MKKIDILGRESRRATFRRNNWILELSDEVQFILLKIPNIHRMDSGKEISKNHDFLRRNRCMEPLKEIHKKCDVSCHTVKTKFFLKIERNHLQRKFLQGFYPKTFSSTIIIKITFIIT